MASIVSACTSMVTGAVGWVTSYVGAVVASGNELLLAFAIVPLVGLGVGLLRRLININ